VPALDGVRGIAILLVLGVHAHALIPGGRLGVDLFFVLSGFLITSLLIGEWERSSTIRLGSFYRRRAVRLLPALLLVVAAYVVVSGLTGHVLENALLGLGYVVNVVQAIHGYELYPFGLGHLWSLGEEEQFYLLWPPLLLLALRRGASRRGLTAILAALVLFEVGARAKVLADGVQFDAAWWDPLLHADPILLGCIAGIAYCSGWYQSPSRIAATFVLAPALAILAFGYPHDRLYAVGMPVFSIAAAVAVFVVAVDPGWWFSRFATMGWLRYLGKISYGLYLWHWPLLVWLGPWRGIPLAFVCAALSYRYVERPLRQWGRKKDQPVLAPAAPAAVPGTT
jgi:peptidoglycan/LPS O-acetylase OafA/YrhL